MSDVKEVTQENVSEEELKVALELLSKKRVRDEKIRTGKIKGPKKYSEFTEEEKTRHLTYSMRSRVRYQLYVEWAKEQGYEVTDEMVDERITNQISESLNK